eukprot:4176222-Amphidinium_carterae.1
MAHHVPADVVHQCRLLRPWHSYTDSHNVATWSSPLPENHFPLDISLPTSLDIFRVQQRRKIMRPSNHQQRTKVPKGAIRCSKFWLVSPLPSPP